MWLTKLRIVLPDQTLERGALRIEDGQIADIVHGPAPTYTSEQIVHGDGLTVLPGIIDMHGDMIESEIEPRPGAEFPLDLAVFELDKRLAANGVTTAYAAISFWEPETESRKHVRSGERARQTAAAVNALRDALLVDLRVHARYEVTTPSVAPALNDLLTRGQVHLLSLMDHTPGQGQYRDLERYIQFIAKWRNTHPAQIEAETHDRIRRAQSMPSIWHTASELVALAHAHGLPIASHDDDTPAKIDAMADFAVTISEFPVTLEAAQEAQRRGLRVAMGAPNVVRGGSHSGNLSALEAIKAGVVDMLAADYSPAALLQAAFALVDHGLLPLHEAAKLLSQNVAAALGLHDRGSIAIGKSADLVLAQGAVRPRVRGTLRRGVPIYWDGSMMHRTGMQVQSEKQKETTLYGAHD